MSKPRLLDLFCGGGGAGMGLHRASFDVTGVDIVPQPHYPFRFIQADALEVDLEGYDAYWASPPCQGYSIMNTLPWLRHKEYPLLILPTLERLEATGKPYILENVMGARHGAKGLAKRGLEAHGLKAGWLCGAMFGLPFYRHRLFATNFLWLAPGHPKHRLRLHPRGAAGLRRWHDGAGKRGPLPKSRDGIWGTGLERWQNRYPGDGVGIGHAKGWRLAAEAMGIDWMTRAELTQSIPPVYAEYVGKRLMEAVRDGL